MKIGLLAMSDNCAERGFISSCHELRAMLNQFGECHLQYCGDISGLFSGMVQELQSAETVVVAVSPRHYLRCKKKLIAALGIPAACSQALQSSIASHAPENMSRERLEEHALVTEGATVFPTADGLYSGFAVESAHQRIVFLTTDRRRMPALIESELAPYFSRITGIPLDTPAEQSDPARGQDLPPEEDVAAPGEQQPAMAEISAALMPEMPAAPVPPPEAPKAPQADPGSAGGDENTTLPLREVLSVRSGMSEHLRAQDKVLALAQTKSSALFRQLDQTPPGAAEPVVYSSYTYDRGRENPREYAAHLALGALEAEGADYGAAVSNIFTSETEKFIYIALSDGQSAHVRRLYLEDGERPEQLVLAAFGDLFRAVEQLNAGMTVRQLAGASPVVIASEREESRTYQIPQRIKLIAGVCVGVLVLVCVIMGLCLRGSSASAFNAADAVDTTYYRFTVQTTAEPEPETAAPKEETTTEETTQEETTEPAVPVTQPQNHQEDAGGVGSEEPAEPPVIHGGSEEPNAGEETPPEGFSGTFTITTYGYGHGVGMSQYGANEFAKEGRTYDQILTHYYSGTVLEQDAAAGTAGIPSADDIARVVQQEMGSSFETEALKAQAVAAYTYARNHGNSIGGMSSVSDISKVSDKVRAAVAEVYGWMVTWNGQPINAVFHAMSAGSTADSRTIWGGTVPYLTPVDSAGDTRQSRYQVTKTYTAQEMADILNSALGVTMSGDPAGWLTVLEHDAAVSAEIGYVKELRVQISAGTYTEISGNYFRENVMGYSRMRSPCFTVNYTA